MEKENVIKTKSYNFALKIVHLYRELHNENEYVLSKQLVRSATSVGANIEEGLHGQSKADFIHKFSIAQKESYETLYWLRLLTDASYLKPEKSKPLMNECVEIQKIITSILVTTKTKNSKF
jgi:four helix bundle protein